MTTTHLLYLHGFRSSPLSTKARMMAERVQSQHPRVTWWCPQLPPSPNEAMDLIREGTRSWPRKQMAVVGSSLGGFYATRLAVELGCRLVVLNPAVHPARDLAKYIGEQTAWHDPQTTFYFKPAFVDELKALENDALPPDCMAIIAKGDEVLDWREMTARYSGASTHLLEGSDHAISEFAMHMDKVFDFLHLA